MNTFVQHLFGRSDSLTAFEMAARAGLMFFITLLFMRISGRRSLGLRTPFDTIITLLLGAVLCRGIVGASPFLSVCAAGLVLVVAHRTLAWLALHSEVLARFVHGRPILLYEKGTILRKNLSRGLVSERELLDNLRLHAAGGDLSVIESAWLETNGKIGVILKKAREESVVS